MFHNLEPSQNTPRCFQIVARLLDADAPTPDATGWNGHSS